MQKVRRLYGVDEYKLDNGLRVLYKRDRTMPVVAVCVTYHVGSRNEAAGHTGSTHILEHLMFKDSKKFNKKNGKAITGYLDLLGSLNNATTWFDRTNYFEVLPREHAEDAIALEADRMRNALFNGSDLTSEMTVVRNEYEQRLNNPYALLDDEVFATAYVTHPYHIPTIGTKEDIESATVSKLREFYDTFYWPNNATLAVFGDLSRAEMEGLVIKYFGKIPKSPHSIPFLDVIEPAQASPRFCEVKKQAGVSIAQISYKSPAASDADFTAFSIASSILAGSFSARMQKHIVDRGFAADISTSVLPTHDPSLVSFTATVSDGVDPHKLLALMRKDIAALVRDGAQKAEIDRARTRALVQLAHSRDGVFDEVREVSEAVAAGDWALLYQYADTLENTTLSDIDRVARKYFIPRTETSGILSNLV